MWGTAGSKGDMLTLGDCVVLGPAIRVTSAGLHVQGDGGHPLL